VSTDEAHRATSRRDLLDELRVAGREHSVATMILHAAVAERLGLNPTDANALSLLERWSARGQERPERLRATRRPSSRSVRCARSGVHRGSDRSDGPSALGSTVTPVDRLRTMLDRVVGDMAVSIRRRQSGRALAAATVGVNGWWATTCVHDCAGN
jgi:hypothetical protein